MKFSILKSVNFTLQNADVFYSYFIFLRVDLRNWLFFFYIFQVIFFTKNLNED